MGSLYVSPEGSASAHGNGTERRSRWRRLALGLFLALCGIALSLWLSWLLGDREEELTKAQFTVDAKERIEALQRIVTARLATVSTMAAFFRASEAVDRKEFTTFVNQILQKQPGIHVLGWAPRVPAAKRRSHEQAVRDEGFPKYAIREYKGPREMALAGERDDYYPLLFLGPERNGQALLGYDLASETAFRAALHEVSSGRPTVLNLSGHDSDLDRSLLGVIEPARCESRSSAAHSAAQPESDGFVVGLFRISELVENALDLFAPIGIDVYVTRPGEKGKSLPVYTRLSASHETAAAPTRESLHHSREIEVGAGVWTVTCVPTATYLAQYQTWGPLGALLAGLFITGLLLGCLHLLARRTAAAEAAASVPL